MNTRLLTLLMTLPFILIRQEMSFAHPADIEAKQGISRVQAPFISNAGQADQEVVFYTNTLGGTVFVTEKGEIVYSLPASGHAVTDKTAKKDIKMLVVRETAEGVKTAGVRGEDISQTRVSYFRGDKPEKWKKDLPTYNVLTFGEVFKGIEMKLKASGNSVEKLFYVKPGADPSDISMSIIGARVLGVNKKGEIEAETGSGSIRFTRPVAYQIIGDVRREVSVSYDIKRSGKSGHDSHLTYGFKVGKYDKTRDLMIDPVLQSTYVGGLYNDTVNGIASDSSGNIYATGQTLSSNFPGTTGGAQSTPGDTAVSGMIYDAFVSKFSSDLKTLVQSTYLGGSGGDSGEAVAIDSGGNVYVGGATASANFPMVTGGAQSVYSGPTTSSNGDGFISRFTSDLKTLVQSTYIGGSWSDTIDSIAIDSAGNIFGGGTTYSPDLPGTTGGAQAVFGGGSVSPTTSDGFLSKFSSDLKTLYQSTYLGENGDDNIYSIAISQSGNVYAAGYTASSNFPGVSGGAQSSYHGNGDGFVSVVSSDLKTIVRSTYLGGSASDGIHGIVLDGSGNAFVTGTTTSTDFPVTTGGAQSSYGGGSGDSYVSRLGSDLKTIVQSTYLGGSNGEFGLSIALDSSGNVYAAGSTNSTNFPMTAGGAQQASGGSYGYGWGDGFISRLTPYLKLLSQSTYLGGSGDDVNNSIIIAPSGNIYAGGLTYSQNFPSTSGGAQPSSGSTGAYSALTDGFVSRLSTLSSDGSSYNKCASTLSAETGLMHIPILSFTSLYYWVDLQYVQTNDGNLMFKVTGYGNVDAGSFTGCTKASLTPDGNLHAPEVIFNNISYWADFVYSPSSDSLVWFRLSAAGQN